MSTLLTGILASQHSNPFELTPRLSEETRAAREALSTTSDTAAPTNPFELQARQSTKDIYSPSTTTATSNPFELAPRQEVELIVKPSIRAPAPIIQKDTSANATTIAATGEPTSTWLLPGLLGILGLTALFYIFFRGLYRKAYKAMFNDNLLSQLYRERSSGNIGGFILAYLLFLLSSSLFLTLVVGRLGYDFSALTNNTFFWVLGAVSAVFILKHFVLALIGYILPIEKEAGRYSFTIMVYGILLGPILSLASLAVAYAAPNLQIPIIYGTAFIVAIAFLIRSLRGLFIANRFIITHGFHFLLYLCAIEIIPLLWIYKLIFRV